jgi:cytochrome P450
MVDSMHKHWDAPHAFWARLRTNAPVALAKPGSPDERPVYYVSRWAEVDTMLRDPSTFSSSINAEGTGQFMGPVMLSMDGEQHRAHRFLVSQAFRASQLAKWEAGLIRPAIDELCDAVAGKGKAELIGEVISRFPVRVICALCGISAEDSPRFLQWAMDIHRGMHNPEVGMAAARAMQTYLEPIVEARRADPGDDLISDIVRAEVDGQMLSDAEIYGFLRLLLPAGSESTFRTMASAVFSMLTIPGLLHRATAERSLLPSIVEETIRWDVANTMVSRVATRDTVLGDCPIPAGSALLIMTSSANRDDSRFPKADTFDPDRASIRHLGFGAGPHQCLGLNLARIELRIGLDAILDRWPNLRLDPEFPQPEIGGFGFRGPSALHVLFDKV